MATAFKAPETLPYIDPADMPDLYAITGKGTCMRPLYDDGVLLVGDKREKPKPGDTVIVYFTREAAQRRSLPGWIKRLAFALPPENVGNFPTLVIVEQLNPPKRYTIPVEHIAGMHKIVGTATSMGKGIAAFRLPKREAQP